MKKPVNNLIWLGAAVVLALGGIGAAGVAAIRGLSIGSPLVV
jgi:hypothetical protein